jgi:DNA modification methylase
LRAATKHFGDYCRSGGNIPIKHDCRGDCRTTALVRSNLIDFNRFNCLAAMTPYYEKNGITIFHGDLREVLPALSLQVDHVVTDPPYGLNFMGRGWDHAVPGLDYWQLIRLAAKPGAMMLAFGGTRTWHHLAAAIEAAMWDIRDTLMWLYGQGMPKCGDIGKMIDKSGLQEDSLPQNELAREIRRKREEKGVSQHELASWFPQYSEVTKNWERLDAGCRIPSETDFQVLVDRLGVSQSWLPFVRGEDRRVLISSDGADRTSDGTVYALGHKGAAYAVTTDFAKRFTGYATALKPAWEPIVLAMNPVEGTVAHNALTYGVAGMNIDGCRISMSPADQERARVPQPACNTTGHIYGMKTGEGRNGETFDPSKGRWPANLLLDEEAAAQLDIQSGYSESTPQVRHNNAYKSVAKGQDYPRDSSGYADSGGASRFFYCAKASRKERGKGNDHPTVKPLALMTYLLTLLSTPTGGLILDPFAGSGTTALAAKRLGRPCLCVELDEHNCEIAAQRLEAANG